MGNAISPRGDMPKNRVQRQLQGRTVSLNSSPFAEELMQPRFLPARLVRTVVLFVAMGKALGGRLRPRIAVVRAIDFDAKAASYVDTFMSAIRWTNADRFFSGVARDAELRAFGTFEETPRAIVMESGAMAATAVIGLLASGVAPSPRKDSVR